MKQAEISGSIAMETSDSLTDLYVQVIVEGQQALHYLPGECEAGQANYTSDSIVAFSQQSTINAVQVHQLLQSHAGKHQEQPCTLNFPTSLLSKINVTVIIIDALFCQECIWKLE